MIVVTVKRPDGKIEEVKTKHQAMTDIMFKKMQEVNLAAGRGEVLSWRDDIDSAYLAELKARDARLRASGWCDKCQSYCYGDCESH
jgi:hypothetical protein